MTGPAAVALAANDHVTSRIFIYCGLLVFVFALIAGFAARGDRRPSSAGRLIELAVMFITLPAVLAVPFYFAAGPMSQADAYFEMVSCLTTTGTSALPRTSLSGTAAEWSGPLPYVAVYWRAQVAWMGGLIILLAAAEIFSPLGVGGFEIVGRRQAVSDKLSATLSGSSPRGLGHRAVWLVVLCYAGLTAALWLLLFAAGDPPVDSLISAMSTISTSGITAEGGFAPPSGSFAGELFVFAFLILALSRVPLSMLRWGQLSRLPEQIDREFCLAGLLIAAAAAAVLAFKYQQIAVARTWPEISALAEGLWGAVFSAVSFLTTTGFQSLRWDAAIEFQPPDFVLLSLLGMALIGGGVATTAGGIKLLRTAELLRFGSGELGRLACPSIVFPAESPGGGARGERTVLACIFMMLFLILLALFALPLSLLGSGFQEAFVLSVSALTNTGPLVDAAFGPEFHHSQLPVEAKLLLCAAMIIGRLELLALITVINPGVWRGSAAR